MLLLQRFFKDRRASVVPLFALSAIPIFGLVGASVDYTRAATVRTALQGAADSTALAMSKQAATLNSGDLSTAASTYFNSVFSRKDAQNVAVSTNYSTTSGSQVVVTGSATVNTMFLGVLGINSIDVSASSTSTWGNTRLRVALVLDNTGSMQQGGGRTTPNKIEALKTATKNLLGQLKDAATKDGDVYVSIIPFSKDVNVGASNYTASWIDWTDWDTKNGTCSKYNGWSTPRNKADCLAASGTWTTADHSTWNGCVTDRDQNYDAMNTAPGSSKPFPAEQYSNCSVPLMAQTYDWTALNSKVDAMTPNGNTNQTIGLAWGWQSLTEGTPLNAPSQDPNYQYQQVVILLTDGLNTENRWDNSATPIDNRTRLACTNIKNAGVTIYAVQVNTGNDPTSTLLQDCASNKPGTLDHFFLLTKPDQIIATFDAIGTNLSKLRLAR
jgi:Flp pilus assembly protein TadG